MWRSLCLWLLIVGGALSVAQPAGAQSSSALVRTGMDWRDRATVNGSPDVRRVERFLGELESLSRGAPGDPELRRLSTLCASLGDSRRALAPDARGALGRAGRDLFRQLEAGPAGPSFHSWVLADVVVSASGAPRLAPDLIEREVALSLLLERGTPGLKTGVLTVARDLADPLRGKALEVLSYWGARFGQDDAVDRCLVRQLSQVTSPVEPRHPMTLLLRRLESCNAPLGPRAAEMLEARLQTMMIQADWRQPARAMRLLKGLSLEARVGLLLDALVVWDRRSRGSKPYAGLARVQSDLVRALQGISGKYFGAQPAPWIDWWVQVRLGEEPRPGSPAFEAERKRLLEEPRSTVNFFGLRPDSDRVTFVIDLSGSMANPWGTTERTRFEEAVEQLVRFLQAGPPEARFNVILFNTVPVVSSVKLVEASAENLERARASLLARVPGGGTSLQPAIERALLLDSHGRPRVEALEADTVVVLCDGATDRGSAWVKPLLDEVLPIYPVRFHTVLIGSRGDGTLEALAEQSGGRFLRVGG